MEVTRESLDTDGGRQVKVFDAVECRVVKTTTVF